MTSAPVGQAAPSRSVGRPRAFDRDDALRRAAQLFWQRGYSGTSTRALCGALGISGSSLYATFGSKAELFDESVRTYALRYRAIYERAAAEPTLDRVVERLLLDSVLEFTRTDEGHPGCLPLSAAVADSSPTLDVRELVADLQREDEALLRARVEQAVAEGELDTRVLGPSELTDLVQTLWQGLSVRAELGAAREELRAVARAGLGLLSAAADHADPIRSRSRAVRRGSPQADGAGAAVRT